MAKKLYYSFYDWNSLLSVRDLLYQDSRVKLESEIALQFGKIFGFQVPSVGRQEVDQMCFES